jgi:RNA polymerase sigma-70 factor (ECF subfamily)
MYDDEYVEAMSVTLPMDVNSRLKYFKVEEVLRNMAPDERKLFELRYIKEMSYREISRVLGKSEGSLRVASLRVKEKIRRKGEEGQWNAA